MGSGRDRPEVERSGRKAAGCRREGDGIRKASARRGDPKPCVICPLCCTSLFDRAGSPLPRPRAGLQGLLHEITRKWPNLPSSLCTCQDWRRGGGSEEGFPSKKSAVTISPCNYSRRGGSARTLGWQWWK